VNAQHTHLQKDRPDGHAPINIMGDHTHKKGEWMLSYRFMNMEMSGNLNGSEEISQASVHEKYMVAPRNMLMQMHMFGVMYAVSEKITIMLMTNYSDLSMNLKPRMGSIFTTRSNGIEDLNFRGLFNVYDKNHQTINLSAGFSIPCGSIDQNDDTHIMKNAPLGYPMQLGSGTWDPNLGLTYKGQLEKLSLGWQINGSIRTGKNKNGYRMGNVLNTVVWGAIKLSDLLSIGTSIDYFKVGKINGLYEKLNPMMMPLANTNNSGRDQMSFGLSTNIYFPQGKFKNIRLGGAINLPVFQEVNGVQMNSKSLITLGIQYGFRISKNEEIPKIE
tara:strand:+ start:476 stop:1465 length:990 start_codon:yes stop_codon:yes gene_type:complete